MTERKREFKSIGDEGDPGEKVLKKKGRTTEIGVRKLRPKTRKLDLRTKDLGFH